jgi:hypothetical protein
MIKLLTIGLLCYHRSRTVSLVGAVSIYPEDDLVYTDTLERVSYSPHEDTTYFETTLGKIYCAKGNSLAEHFECLESDVQMYGEDHTVKGTEHIYYLAQQKQYGSRLGIENLERKNRWNY